MMQKVVVSVCASTLPDAIACWYLLHPIRAISVPPPEEDLVSKPMWCWVCGSRQQKSFIIIIIILNGVMCFDGSKACIIQAPLDF